MTSMLLSKRIAADGLACTSEPREGPPEDEISPDPDMRWYDVTLHLDGREFRIPLGLGPLAGEPEACDVVSLVTMGVRSVYYSGSLREWAAEWGRDPDDETTLTIYGQWQRILGRLWPFLGDRFDAYMDETQDDN